MTTSGRPQPSEALLALAAKLFDLARQGNTEALIAYLSAGAPADLTNDKGDSLVMLAAYHGHAETVQALLDHGADPNRINDRGQSPLAGAIFKNAVDVVRVLVDHGADPSFGNPSALETARMFGKTDLLARVSH